MTRLVKAEFLKLRTTRTSKVFIAVALLLTALFVTILVLARDDLGVVSEEEKLRLALSRSANLAIFVLVLGVVAAAGEYRHDTASSTFLVTPVRWRGVIAQALAFAGLGGLLALVSTAFTAALVLPVFASDAPGLALSTVEIVLLLLGCVVACAMWAALGVGLGALIGDQAWAVTAALVYLLLVEQVIMALSADVGRFTVQGATTSATGSPPLESLPGWAGVLVLAAWTALFAALGAARTMARDVT